MDEVGELEVRNEKSEVRSEKAEVRGCSLAMRIRIADEQIVPNG
jgi:hypothetical protein